MKEKSDNLTDFLDAIRLAASSIRPTGKTKSVSLFDAVGMTLAEDIYCQKPLPAFNNSAMDGYGVRLADAGKRVVIKSSVFAGDETDEVLIRDGECIKIMTGAFVPPSVEAVVPFENAVSVDEEGVVLPEGLKKWANIRKEGEESSVGDKLLSAGDTLSAAAIGTLASQGMFVVKVAAKPRVAVISSGNEIAEPWESAGKTQIYNSNAPMLMALCKEKGCEPDYVRLVSDSYEATLDMIRSLKGYDLILTTGGISMGEADFIGKAFLECGLNTIFKKIALKPGKPTMLGYLGDTVVLALPGNPISAIANFYVFGSIVAARLTGAKACNISSVKALNKSSFDIKTSRANLILGHYENGEFEVFEGNKYGSGMLKPMVQSNAFILTGMGIDRLEAGEYVDAVLIGGRLGEKFFDFVRTV